MEFSIHGGYKGTDLSYDMLCELIILDNSPKDTWKYINLILNLKNTKKMGKQLCHACSDVSISQIKEENEKDQGNFLAYVEAYEARLYYLSYSTRKGIHTLCKEFEIIKGATGTNCHAII